MGIESRTIEGGTAYWLKPEDGDARDIAKDTTAYQTYAAKDDPRLYCDKCARCIVYKCDGRTATHHFIHIDEVSYFTQSDEEHERGLLPNRGRSEHSDRNSGV